MTANWIWSISRLFYKSIRNFASVFDKTNSRLIDFQLAFHLPTYAYLIFLLCRFIILMTLRNDTLLLLHSANVAFDDGVQLLAHIILDIHLVIHYFACYCLLEFCCCFLNSVDDDDDDYAFPDKCLKKKQVMREDSIVMNKKRIVIFQDYSFFVIVTHHSNPKCFEKARLAILLMTHPSLDPTHTHVSFSFFCPSPPDLDPKWRSMVKFSCWGFEERLGISQPVAQHLAARHSSRALLIWRWF